MRTCLIRLNLYFHNINFFLMFRNAELEILRVKIVYWIAWKQKVWRKPKENMMKQCNYICGRDQNHIVKVYKFIVNEESIKAIVNSTSTVNVVSRSQSKSHFCTIAARTKQHFALCSNLDKKLHILFHVFF